MSQAGEQFHCALHSPAAGRNGIGLYGNKHNSNQVVVLCYIAWYENLKNCGVI